MRDSSIPGAGAFGPAVAAFDDAVDRALERVRGNPSADRLMTIATTAAEFSVVWHAASIARGLARGRHDQIVALAIGIAAESLIVNQVLKPVFRRDRPTEAGDERFEIRRPITSSFPSGHASAAAFAATTLIAFDGPRWAALWLPAAATIAVSRPYVRIHHASDVVAGAAVGVGLGLVARSLFRRAGVL